jgi:hypothetical protein
MAKPRKISVHSKQPKAAKFIPHGAIAFAHDALKLLAVLDGHVAARVDDAKCATWLNKKEKARTTGCVDPAATLACRSFQELLAGNDSDLMDDFATKEHVYICFRPKEDTFLDIYFSALACPLKEP